MLAAGGGGELKSADRLAWALLCAFVFTIPWEKSVWVPAIGSIARFLGLIAFAAGALVAIRWRRPPRLPRLSIPAAPSGEVFSAPPSRLAPRLAGPNAA